jgi:hypothetical protein
MNATREQLLNALRWNEDRAAACRDINNDEVRRNLSRYAKNVAQLRKAIDNAD